MKYRLVIFDLDGTLLETLTDLTASLNHTLKCQGLPERSRDEVRNFVGNGIPKLIERACPPEYTPEQREPVCREFTAYYLEHCTDATAPYEGILPLLKKLRDGGIRIAGSSNKADEATRELCGRMFPGMTDFVLGSRKDIPNKPATDGVRMIMETLECKADETVYVGDSDVDIRTAENAGIRCISVSWGFRDPDFLREHGATEIIDRPEELAEIIESTGQNVRESI